LSRSRASFPRVFRGFGAGDRRAAGIALALLLVAVPVRAAEPHGGELQVNVYTLDDQRTAAVAATPAGGFVVAWHSYGSDGSDSSGASVQARRFAASGRPAGGPLQANVDTTGHQLHPGVAVDAAGRFVVVWRSNAASAGDPSESAIRGRAFDAAGTPVGGELQVNDFTPGVQRFPSVTAVATGFVVAWVGYGSAGDDQDATSVHARRLDPSGAPTGPELQLNELTSGHQRGVAIAPCADGGFVAAWHSDVSDGTDTSDTCIRARRFGPGGVPSGPEAQVNERTLGAQLYPSVATEVDGGFVVAWMSYDTAGTDTSRWSIAARRFALDGTPRGEEWQVNELTELEQVRPAIAASTSGFVVTWTSRGSFGSDDDVYSVQARHFDAHGVAAGPQFQVNTTTSGDQDRSDVAFDAAGNFVVVWDSYASAGTDDCGLSVQAQRYDQLFRDGFESGDTRRWLPGRSSLRGPSRSASCSQSPVAGSILRP
jgi:hypothetical protein